MAVSYHGLSHLILSLRLIPSGVDARGHLPCQVSHWPSRVERVM